MDIKYDLFISHSSQDQTLAYAICHYLEERDIRCWIAPRDVRGGVEYAEAIINGIRTCKIMVVVFNSNANQSKFVKNEVERAFNYGSVIMPFRVDGTLPSATMELFLGSVHWLDAVEGKAENYFELLYENCAKSLGKPLRKITSTAAIGSFPSVEKIASNQQPSVNHYDKSIYYYEKEGNPHGPHSLSQLSQESIHKDTLLWKEGMTAWRPASEFEELRPLFHLLPPPITKRNTPPLVINPINDIEVSFPIKSIIHRGQEYDLLLLDVTHFANGNEIPEARTNEEWIWAGENEIPAWCYYNNDQNYGSKNGKLYNWYAVSDRRSLLPRGCFFPSSEEWSEIQNKLIQEGYLKIISTKNNGLNGRRELDGSFIEMGLNGYYWDNIETNEKRAQNLSINYQNIALNSSNKKRGLSVMCLSRKGEYNKGILTSTNPTVASLQLPEVVIGKRIWSSKNLNVSHFQNGDLIPESRTNEEWIASSVKKKPAWCYYKNDKLHGEKYGKLFNWYAINDKRKLAPDNWVIPKGKDYADLVDFLGGEKIAGEKLKNMAGWTDQLKHASNSSGFSAIPGGLRDNEGRFRDINNFSYFWCASEEGFSNPAAVYLSYYYPTMFFNSFSPGFGFSVRCFRLPNFNIAKTD